MARPVSPSKHPAAPPPALVWLGLLEMFGRRSLPLGQGPLGLRRLDFIGGGTLSGPGLRGEVTGGADHLLCPDPDRLTPENRVSLRLDCGAAADLVYEGHLVGPETVIADILARRPTRPEDYAIRISARIRTGSQRHGWLNRALVVGEGALGPLSDGRPGIAYRLWRLG
ncbi:MAG: DUF3237 domain-containing protein [Rhodobacteraceae bacterium]|nr:DUF3237 domain-containing protein [Paracoccaceae bacterium]